MVSIGDKVMGQGSNEHRRHSRRRVLVGGWLHFRGDDEHRDVATVDLGRDGARFDTVHVARLSEPVVLRLRLDPATAPLECKGKVCWTQRLAGGVNRIGVHFLDLSDEERDQLDRFLARGGSDSHRESSKHN
ncbi:MAG: PilZ domain-containing protein [Candidatus Hydrogenedentes bacterium]|nr:PilZ domain-containing protein [Candidatus Hydrogenedentota bacterium]